MHCLDFISYPPKIFIFQKESNKTNLGGIFFFIYILIVILISLFLFYDYSQTDKYSFSSYDIEEISISNEEANKRINSSKFNPSFDFSFELENYTDHNLSSKFVILDLDNKEDILIQRSNWYKKNVHGIQFSIFYDCNPNNCSSINKEDLSPTTFGYYLRIKYKGPVLDHYNETPIYNVIDLLNNNSSISNDYEFFFNTPSHYSIGWEVIEYHDQIGILDIIFNKKRKSQYFGGKFEIYQNFISDDFFKPYDYMEKYYNLKLLCTVNIHSNVEKTITFIRKEKSIIDIIANICSLSLTIYHALCIIFSKIYSKNFDSYKIIQKILDNNIKNQGHIELNSVLDKKESLMPLSKDDINFKTKIINKSTSDYEGLNYNFISNKEIENCDNTDEKNTIKMPRLKTSDYLLNNVYNFKQWKSYKQEVITFCKEILLKYLSIEKILYNQIKLENLFLDYKWNNPNLRFIKNNEYIDKLKYKLNELNIT